jgi:hypothetical protein
MIGLLNGLIVACDDAIEGYKDCWTYLIKNDSWQLLTSSSYEHRFRVLKTWSQSFDF